jgi:NADPH oxidase
MLNASKYSSGLDFSDPSSALDEHPDVPSTYANGMAQPAHLQRNKTERRRLQGLQRSLTATTLPKGPHKPNGWRQKYNLWMINEGGSRIVFCVWIFLHLLVTAFGFLNYQMKDNLNNARATFGITYGESLHSKVWTAISNYFSCP